MNESVEERDAAGGRHPAAGLALSLGITLAAALALGLLTMALRASVDSSLLRVGVALTTVGAILVIRSYVGDQSTVPQ